MLAEGFPLLRTTLHTRTLHQQYLGASFVWLRTTGHTVQTLVVHEVEELLGHENNPVWKVGLNGETLRRRVDVADGELDFPILHALKAEGAIDYFASPVKSALGTNYTVTYATDRIGGVTVQAVYAARGLTSNPSLVGEPPLEIVVARHIGTAIYGNIGAANQLDFTVIGPAVNLVSRIEAMAKTLNLPIVVSADFARAYGQPLHPLFGAKRLVHISGIGADAASPSPYIRSRGQGEAAVQAAFPGVVIIRPAVMFAQDDSFLTTILRLLRVLPAYPIFGDGRTRLCTRMTWRRRSHKSCGKANGRLPSTNWLARASILMSR
jgi:class 3 adenylate cyclase